MKIIITETIRKEKEIDIELPYYYEHDLMSDYGDCYIYGKITDKEHISINIDHYYDGKDSTEIEIERINNFNGLSGYLNPSNTGIKKITEGQYLNAKGEAIKLLGKC
jgi:hypothetical protein